MLCMGCSESFAKKYITLCHGCKGWYCRECRSDHKPCNDPLLSSNRKDPAIVKPQSPFESGQELKTEQTDNSLKTFDRQLFREFQGKAGCVSTQELAIQLWKQVKDSLLPEERSEILTAWGDVSNMDSVRQHASPVVASETCNIDRVCNRIYAKYTCQSIPLMSSEFFIG